jgi:hypothetical protein
MVEAQEALMEAARGVPEAERTRVFLGTWSLMDLLAHLAGWDHANMEAVEAVRAGRLPAFYEHRDRDWRTFNAMLVEKYGRESFEEMMRELRLSHQQWREVLEAVPERDFSRDFGVRFRGYKVTIQRLVEAETKDERVHLGQVEEFVREGREASTN